MLYGIFWYDRYKPIFECIINLVVSIVLAKRIGVLGVFLGTIISTVTTSLWIEPYVLYKHGLKSKIMNYFKRFTIYTVITICSFVVMKFACGFIAEISLLTFIIKGIICVAIFNVILILCFNKTEEFKYYINLIKEIISKIVNRGKAKFDKGE